jgi:xylose isomerase
MRTYNILKERAHAFDSDPEVKELIADIVDPEIDPLLAGYSSEKAQTLRQLPIDPEVIGSTGLGWERLDQLLMEHLLGSR